MKSNSQSWRRWIRLDRLIPLATILSAFLAILLAGFQVLDFSIFEGLALALLGLMGFDALAERMGILERIQTRLESIENVGPSLWPESKLLRERTFKDFISGANEIFIFGGSLTGLFNKEYKTIHDWLSSKKSAKKSATLKIILVDPQLVRDGKITVQSLFRYLDWEEEKAREYYAHEAVKTLEIIASLRRIYPGTIKVRLTKETPSVTILMVDQRKARISINLYQNDPTERPMFEIHKDDPHPWYTTFEELYYRQVWEKSRPLND